MSLAQIFLSEFFGTLILILFGAGVCAAVNLPKSKAQGSGWIVIAFGWGLAVFMGVYAAYATGGHLNPAVTIGLAVAGKDLAAGVPATAANICIYILAQMLGAIVGAVCAWLAYKKHFDEEAPADAKLGCFSTGPGIRSYGWNVVTEAIATFTLVAWVIYNGKSPSELGPLAVAFVIVAIGLSLGGPTGYAINPARDLGPRIAYAILPIRGKGSADWAYAWVPVVGPLIGAVVAGLLIPNMAGLF
ncbi:MULTISPECIES: MIP/aquaporin family protein [unclassified Actinomyces]|uniref:MIP/aquaporin family protein n=1 Tax=unclassified Actinomyces TaxID=2609248 RepID=UPI001373EA9A|nr:MULTISPECIES: MIP/aquaporin family protein [unclassified Actinomyces]MBW3069403.1 aquaporin family protein [Actinomyces sp. 594]NDR54736.1 aquaporin family protein [Actinomyces sp. 565]QHO91742.1 aquaporin family protein [Actinomyces sp. 432]